MSEKVLIAVGILASFTFLFFVSLKLFLPTNNSSATPSFSSSDTAPLSQNDNFLRSAFSSTVPFGSGFVNGNQNNASSFGSLPSLSEIARQIRASVSSSVSSPLTNNSIIKKELIPLPQVLDLDISINPAGVSSTVEYIKYLDLNYRKINFPYQNFTGLLKDKNGFPIFSIQTLAEKVLETGNFSEVHDSVSILAGYLRAKDSFLKSMPVAGEVADLNKKVIAVDELQITLSDKILDAESGKISRQELEDFYTKFSNTVSTERNKFLQVFNFQKQQSRKDFFENLLSFLGLEKVFAQAFCPGLTCPFGGQIVFMTYCVCSLNFLVSVGPPVTPVDGALFVPIWFLATPLFYNYKTLGVGVWWLGLYYNVTIECETPPPYCPATQPGDIIIMTGTSML